MDTRFLRSLVAVVETGSIAAAARKENLTAAAISQRIQALERIFSCELLIRGAHSITPSEHCLALLPRMRTLIRMAAELHSALEEDSLSGDLRVGAISTALTGILPRVMEQLSITAPALRLRITPGDSRSLYEQVVNGELDGAILVQPPFALPKTFRCDVVRAEPLILVSDQPVKKSDIKSIILDRPLIGYDSNSWGGQIAMRYLVEHELNPEILCELDSLEAISILVKKGMGVSLVPAWVGLDPEHIHVALVSEATRYLRRIALLTGLPPRRPLALDALRSLLSGIPPKH